MWTDPSGELALFIHGGYGRVIPDNQGGGTYAYEFANQLQQDGVIPADEVILKEGPGCISPPLSLLPPSSLASPGDQQRVVEHLANLIIAFHDENCGEKPIFIYGVSRGGGTAQLIAAAVFTKRPDVSIDLVATIAPVHAPDHPSAGGGLPTNRKMPNVLFHLNFLSEQERAVLEAGHPETDWPPPLFPPIRELRIDGAVNQQFRGTSHRSLTLAHVGIFRKVAIPVAGEYPKPDPDVRYEYERSVPNPAWEKIRSRLISLYQGA